MEKINDESIDLILSNKFDENFWLFELGRVESVLEKAIPLEHQFMGSFLKKGERLWEKNKEKLKNILCDKEHKKINSIFETAILGNERELVVAIYLALTNTHNIEAAITIPLIAIVLKKKLDKFCSQ